MGGARHIKFRAATHCRVLPSGEFNGVIPERRLLCCDLSIVGLVIKTLRVRLLATSISRYVLGQEDKYKRTKVL